MNGSDFRVERGTAPADGTDWRTQIDERKRLHLRVWLYTGAALTFLILVIGGITRLTQSGLSIVDWRPIMGVIPPLTEAQWWEAFDQYRAYPEYQLLRQGMTLAEFQFIFFWEYLHRMVARLIGLVFLIPFVFFWLRGYLNRPLTGRLLLLFALGAAQGVMGWLMVASGLVDVPHVSHYRLAAHLSLAFAIFGCCLWFARDLAIGPARSPLGASTMRTLRRGLYLLGGLLGVQIVWGAFVAGMKAGFVFNTFPLMAGRLVPPQLLEMQPLVANFFENAITVQWTHRVLGTILGAAAIWLYLKVRRMEVDAVTMRLNLAFFALILAQYGLGVLTLIYRVPVSLGVAHQAMAMVIFGVWIVWVHHLRTAPVAREHPDRTMATAPV
jgi:heme a synthase